MFALKSKIKEKTQEIMYSEALTFCLMTECGLFKKARIVIKLGKEHAGHLKSYLCFLFENTVQFGVLGSFIRSNEIFAKYQVARQAWTQLWSRNDPAQK